MRAGRNFGFFLFLLELIFLNREKGKNDRGYICKEEDHVAFGQTGQDVEEQSGHILTMKTGVMRDSTEISSVRVPQYQYFKPY